MKKLTNKRIRQLLASARKMRVLVIGDVMLDQFIWGRVTRISPEAPVPVLEFQRESFMPGGAANVARNLTLLGAKTRMISVIGRDPAGKQLRQLLNENEVNCDDLLVSAARMTTKKARIIAHQQQIARVDREQASELTKSETERLLTAVQMALPQVDAMIVGDYGKGIITQTLLDELKRLCRRRAVWLSLDPKPVHALDLSGLSLITPNRKEAFELARVADDKRRSSPLKDERLLAVASKLLSTLKPALLLITLGDQGMLLCQHGRAAIHIPTVAREVFDVSGAGDTVIATFTLAVAAGASPLEAAILSNHAAGVVVGKVGTATVTADELFESFKQRR